MKIWKSIVTVVAAIAVIGCADDGGIEFAKGSDQSLTAAKPIIKLFKSDADKIQAGGSVTLNWEVLGADKVTIAAQSAGGKFQYSGGPFQDLKSSTKVDGIPETTTFTLTATKTMAAPAATPPAGGGAKPKPKGLSFLTTAAPPPAAGTPPAGGGAPSGSGGSTQTSTATVTVTVTPSNQVNVTVTADDEQIEPGTPTVIRWTVVPADAKVEVAADNSEPIVSYDLCEGDAAAITAGAPAKAFAAKQCAVVQPEEPSTTYTVTATDASGNKGTGSVTIAVAEAALTAKIFINGQEADQTVRIGDTIVVSWTVEPAGAKITVTADGNAQCDSLPAAEVSDQTSANCVISGLAGFKLHAELEGKIAEDSINALLAASANVNVTFNGDRWAFAGEEVTLEISAADAQSASAIQNVQVSGYDQPAPAPSADGKWKFEHVKVPAGGVQVNVGYGDGQHRDYQAVVTAIDMSAMALGSDEKAITRVAFDPNSIDRSFRGVDKSAVMNGDALDQIRYYDNGAQKGVDIASAFAAVAPFQNGFLSAIGDYPVSAIAVRPGHPEQMFIGTTGLVLYSSDSGVTWAKFTSYSRKAGDAANGSHATCGGKTLAGINASYSDQIVGMGQVCDIIVKEDCRVIIATDRGVRVIRDCAAFLTDWHQSPQIGVPAEGTGADESSFKTYGHVVHDIEYVADGDLVFAATDRGVYVSRDGGEGFEDFRGSMGETQVFAVAYHGPSGQIFAGAADGSIYVSSVQSASWTKKGQAGQQILSLAVDPTSTTERCAIIAGTEAGAKVSRDAGVTFSAVPGSPEGAVSSVAIATSVEGNRIKYQIAIGSAAGGLAGHATAADTGPASCGPTELCDFGPNPPQTPPVGEPEPANPEGGDVAPDPDGGSEEGSLPPSSAHQDANTSSSVNVDLSESQID